MTLHSFQNSYFFSRKYAVKWIAVTLLLIACNLMTSSAFSQDEQQPSATAQESGEQKATADENPATEPETGVDMADVSYVIGVNLGRTVLQSNFELNIDAFNKGLKAALAEADLEMTDEEMVNLMDAFAIAQREKEAQRMLEMQAENKKKGEDFLAENKRKDGVKTTESGLQYRVINAGDASGKQPGATDSVTVHYKGTFMDGDVFDSSVARGEPAVIGLDGVIAGWTEALQLMHEGDKWELVLPSNLAYGERGDPRGTIGPNEVLIFEVELIKVNEKSTISNQTR